MIETVRMLKITPHLYRVHVRPKLREEYQGMSLAKYQAKHPLATHIGFWRDHGGAWVMFGIGPARGMSALWDSAIRNAEKGHPIATLQRGGSHGPTQTGSGTPAVRRANQQRRRSARGTH